MSLILTKKQFKAARTKRGLTQQEFADLLGYGLATVQKKEQGTRSITSRDALLIKSLYHSGRIVKINFVKSKK